MGERPTEIPVSSLIDWLWPPKEQTHESSKSVRRFVSFFAQAQEISARIGGIPHKAAVSGRTPR